jgi:hypothetical protein
MSFSEVVLKSYIHRIRDLQGQSRYLYDHFKSNINEHVAQSEVDYIFEVDDKSVPELVLKSLFLVTYSELENCLNDFANSIQVERSLNISYEDIRGSGLKRYIFYFEKIAGMHLTGKLRYLEELQHLNKLRNHYAHDGRSLISHKDPVYKSARFFKLTDDRDIYKEGHTRIALSYDFLSTALFTVFLFLEDLKDLVGEFYAER